MSDRKIIDRQIIITVKEDKGQCKICANFPKHLIFKCLYGFAEFSHEDCLANSERVAAMQELWAEAKRLSAFRADILKGHSPGTIGEFEAVSGYHSSVRNICDIISKQEAKDGKEEENKNP